MKVFCVFRGTLGDHGVFLLLYAAHGRPPTAIIFATGYINIPDMVLEF